MSDMWECECGIIEYGKNPPEECDKCWKMNGFTKVPEDLIEEKKEMDLGKKIKGTFEEEDEDDE
ncbi:hypothetical protein AUJ84_03180 [Candidatus Pacearchaeota archaeon CG1_02_32_132]|nr:MAG: hypothetical protein AUJ84_03180 [Candidatus Pacearchaeota archaeon CG1_02_32_132]